MEIDCKNKYPPFKKRKSFPYLFLILPLVMIIAYFALSLKNYSDLLLAQEHNHGGAEINVVSSSDYNASSSEVNSSEAAQSATSDEREILYYYDPMYPGTHFDKPGKSPFMDMDLVPRYAEEDKGLGITVDPTQLQNLGLKTSKVINGKLSFARDFPADVEFNTYKTAVIQPRADGFVVNVTPHAVGDYVEEGEVLAIITVPAWASDQSEYLLLKNQNASKSILQGVREKMRISGMPEEMLSLVDSTGKVQTELNIISPERGVITELSVFKGMNVDKSMTLAIVQGTDPAWVTAYIPEKDLHLTEGMSRVTLPAFPDRAFVILDS
jgi:Cu(I)/Ag(I) efflux system membrane fusion protein